MKEKFSYLKNPLLREYRGQKDFYDSVFKTIANVWDEGMENSLEMRL